ncbi:uncharacterized protein LOC115632964 [Scaptodrosophila lebanonensis]|uniref:Uncharacterized protein LOC115632964 n=1 Tax=Drosophila lebanonensis TaxID=7225 RepID=A0A6J2UDA3_DROLE|nr:uncharacterized protein LOC115632964 [Scaptodrosophila lebanonensis]
MLKLNYFLFVCVLLAPYCTCVAPFGQYVTVPECPKITTSPQITYKGKMTFIGAYVNMKKPPPQNSIPPSMFCIEVDFPPKNTGEEWGKVLGTDNKSFIVYYECTAIDKKAFSYSAYVFSKTKSRDPAIEKAVKEIFDKNKLSFKDFIYVC